MKLVTYIKFFLFACSLVLAFILVHFSVLRHIIISEGNIGYLGAFLAGVLYIYTFSVAVGTVLIVILGHTLSPLLIAFIASAGAVIGDYLLFHASKHIRSKVSKPLPQWIRNWLHKPYLKWIIITAGIITLITPLPDELGVGVLSMSKINTFQFIILSFLFQFISIMLLLQLVKI